MAQDYSPALMEHFESPRNVGRMPGADAAGYADVGGRAPRMTIYLKPAGSRVERASFQCFGCGAAIAAGSVLTEMVTGQTIEDCRTLTESDVDQALRLYALGCARSAKKSPPKMAWRRVER